MTRLTNLLLAARSALRSPRLAILFVVFLVTAGMGMVWSTLAVFATTIGASTAMVGLLIAAFGGARLIVNLPAGMASERFGRHRIMLLGLALLALASIAATGVTLFPALLVCLLFQGVGCSMFVTAALAAVADLGTPESRIRDMASYQAASSIGISVGPGMGGLSAAAWGHAAPFVLQSIFAVLAVLMVSATAPKGGVRGGGARTTQAGPRGALDRRLIGGVAVLTYGALFARVSATWVLLPLVAQVTLGMTIAEIGFVLTAGAVANLLVLPLVNPATRRFGRLALTMGSAAATIVSVLLLAGAHAPLVGWVSACLLAASSGITMPLLAAYAIDAAPAGAVGAAMGMLRTMTDLGIVTGPVVVGLIVDRLGMGYAGGLWFTALVLAVSAGLFWLAVRSKPTT